MSGTSRNTFFSLITSKRVIVSVVAAVAMVLGAMSVGAAVVIYKKIPEVIGSKTAPANPFPGSGDSVATTHFDSQAKPAGTTDDPSTVIAVQGTDAAAAIASADSTAQPTQSGHVAGASTSTSSTGSSTRPASIAPAVTVPLAPVLQPVTNTVQQLVNPIIPQPLQDLVNGVTGALPTQLDAGLVTVTLPKIAL
jgi:hypothetical protein